MVRLRYAKLQLWRFGWYKSTVNTWTTQWLLGRSVVARWRAVGARPGRREPGQQQRSDQGLRPTTERRVHDRLHGGILSSSINPHDDADHPLTHAPPRECGFRDADGSLVLNLVESGSVHARSLQYLLISLHRQLHHMSSLTPLTAPCNETFNHLLCWQRGCVWLAKVSIARRQEAMMALCMSQFRI